MLSLMVIVGSPVQASCVEMVPLPDRTEVFRVNLNQTVTTKNVSCRPIKLAKVGQVAVSDLKASIKTWDDSRKTFGDERIHRVEGLWVLDLPELRVDDDLRIRLTVTPNTQDSLFHVDDAHGLGLTDTEIVEWVIPESRPVFGPDGNVKRRRKSIWAGPLSVGVHHAWAPAGAGQVQCHASGGEVDAEARHEGCAFRVTDDATSSLEMEWIEEGVGPSDEWQLVEGQRLRIVNPEINVLATARTDESGTFIGPGRVSVLINQLGTFEVRNDALREVSDAAKMVSIPEPGLGLQYKGRVGGLEMVEEILALVREQVQNGQITDVHPLKPRPLMKVRKSGWATPWEQALLLTRYLGQLKIAAIAYPVRPSSSGQVLDGVPDGYVDAVVQAGTGEDAIWIDPSCRVCAVDEIDPDLWEGQVFSPHRTALPKGDGGEVVSRMVDGRLVVNIRGDAAVRLRIWLMPLLPSQRGPFAAEMFAGPGATLEEHQGFPDLGEPIRLVINP